SRRILFAGSVAAAAHAIAGGTEAAAADPAGGRALVGDARLRRSSAAPGRISAARHAVFALTSGADGGPGAPPGAALRAPRALIIPGSPPGLIDADPSRRPFLAASERRRRSGQHGRKRITIKFRH